MGSYIFVRSLSRPEHATNVRLIQDAALATQANRRPSSSMTEPRSLRDKAERQRRRQMLDAQHMRPLVSYVASLRSRPQVDVPDFDPMDGGVDAELLFLFEKPGPMTKSSGFISRDNDDPTAEATYRFMIEAGIPRTTAVIWNAVPWWDGTRRISGTQLREGLQCIDALLALLPKVRAVVLVGKKAQRARSHFVLPVFTSSHPSPLVRAKHPERWAMIPAEWRGAAGQTA